MLTESKAACGIFAKYFVYTYFCKIIGNESMCVIIRLVTAPADVSDPQALLCR
jgi:hypothetical protein